MPIYEPKKHAKKTIRICKDYEDDYDVVRSQFHFLQDIWDINDEIDSPAFSFLAFRKVTTGKWIEKAIEIPLSLQDSMELLNKFNRWDYDQYFCPNLFSKPRRKQQYALSTRLALCDMDESDPETYDPWASLVWRTSPNRYQALWLWDQPYKAHKAEQYSKALAYRHGGDKNGWSCTNMLRLIGSVNHKPQYSEPFVEIVRCDWKEIQSRPLLLKGSNQLSVARMPDIDVNPEKHNCDQVLKRYRKFLHPKVRTLISNRKAYEPDKSAQIFHIIIGLHEAGASPDEIASVLWINPYFIEKHGRNLGKLNEEIARVISKLGGVR